MVLEVNLEDAKEIVSQIDEPQKDKGVDMCILCERDPYICGPCLEENSLPKKVVVPKFVAEWIEELKKSHSNLAWVWQVYPNEPKVKNWLESNTEKFMRAWLDGYAVEQEKLYTVEIPDPHGMYKIRYLFRNNVGNIRIGGTDYRDIFLDAETHLTEAEIKKDFEWAWDAGFAKEVE